MMGMREVRLLGVAGLAMLAATGAIAQKNGAKKPAVPAGGEQVSQRTEILTFDNWRVTCQENAQSGGKRTCTGQLNIAVKAQNQGAQPQVVFTWLLGLNEGKAISVFQVPTGVLIAPGMEMKIGSKFDHKEGYRACAPQLCEVTLPMTDAFVKSAIAAATSEFTISALDGRKLKFTVNMKGFDKALAEVRK